METVKLKIKISTLEEVNKLCGLVCQMSGDVFLKSGRYIVNADSVLGVLSLPIPGLMDMEIISKDDREVDSFLSELEKINLIRGGVSW